MAVKCDSEQNGDFRASGAIIKQCACKTFIMALLDYETCQELQPGSIGSGAVESAVKQIGRRLKISGAQWKSESVSQMLQLRCAYLNGEFAV
jgi:hypothetical protein